MVGHGGCVRAHGKQMATLKYSNLTFKSLEVPPVLPIP